MERDMFRAAVSQKSLGTTGLHVMLHMKHFRVVSYRRRITILAHRRRSLGGRGDWRGRESLPPLNF